MDRQIVYPGSIPLDTDLLGAQRNTMVALGALAQCVLGTNPVVSGLLCVPTTPPSLQVLVGPGSFTTPAPLDPSPYGSMPAEPAMTIIKTGINLDSAIFTVAPPTASGQAITWLVQAAFAEEDVVPVVLPYYNAANPAQPFGGPGNNGNAQPTRRRQVVALQCKPGAPAPAGSQAAPPVDQGWVGLWLITLAYGQSAVTAGDIHAVPGAPFLPFQLPQLTAGFSRQSVITLSGGWAVPQGVRQARVRVVGAGGGGGGGSSSYSGGGGGAGGFAQAIIQVLPGTVIPVTIGQGGAGGQPGQTGSAGGSSTFGGVIGATGGGGGGSNNPFSQGGPGGVGQADGSVRDPLTQFGGYGADGYGGATAPAGVGGASIMGGGGRGASGGGAAANGQAAGSGGGGAYGGSAPGGQGANGFVLVEF